MTTPTTPTTSKLRAQASGYADEAIDATAHALDQTRHFANQALDRAGEKVRDLRSGAKDLASRGMNTMSSAGVAAQRQVGHYAQATTRYVSEQPVKAALIAAAVGAGVAALILALRRHHDRQDY